MACCQQFELYGAEEAISSAHGRAVAPGDLQDYVTRLGESAWWQRNFEMVEHVEAYVRKGGGASIGSWHGDAGAGIVEMLPCHLVEMYVLHEVSHVLAAARFGSHAHDPWFAATYLQAVSTYMGSEAYMELRAAFDRAGIDYDAAQSFVPAGREMG